jgi:hypothetical protein
MRVPAPKRRNSSPRTRGPELQIAALAITEPEQRYFQWVEGFWARLYRISARRSRAVGLAMAATVVLAASVPLAQALDWPDAVSAILGFLIVVVQGLQRYYSEHTEASGELDYLVRGVATEARTLRAEQPPYDDRGTRLHEFHGRIERRMARYNEASTKALRMLYQETDPAATRG